MFLCTFCAFSVRFGALKAEVDLVRLTGGIRGTREAGGVGFQGVYDDCAPFGGNYRQGGEGKFLGLSGWPRTILG